MLSEDFFRSWDEILVFYRILENDNIKELQQTLTNTLGIQGDHNLIMIIKSKLNDDELLSFPEIFIFTQLLHNFFTLKKHPFKSLFEDFLNFKILEEETVPDSLLLSINYFNDEGEFQFHKHPQFKNLNLQLITNENKIREIIIHARADSIFKSSLRDYDFDYLGGRACLPVHSGKYNKKMGNIRGHSNSGNTLFVEPDSLSDLNQEHVDILREIEHLKFKILIELYEDIKHLIPKFPEIINFYKRSDILQSKINYHLSHNYCIPQIEENNGIEFTNLSFPFINNCVPNDFNLDKRLKASLITGKNGGGKSIYLKGISFILFSCTHGLPCPSSQVKLPFFNRVTFISGSNDSFINGESSFVHESTQIIHHIHNAKENDFLIVDEVFSSTDTDEASLLAYQVIKKCISINSYSLFSTHHGKLKNFCFLRNDIDILKVTSDDDITGQKFKVTRGAPGQSNAISTFQKIEFKILGSDNLSQQANAQLSQADKESYSIMDDLLRKQNEITREKSDIDKLKKELIQKISQAENDQEIIKIQFKEKYKRKMDKLIALANKQLNEISSQTPKNARKKVDAINTIKNQIGERESWTPGEVNSVNNSASLHIPEIGDQIRCKVLNREGIVIAVKNNKIKAQFGKITSYTSNFEVIKARVKAPKKVNIHVCKPSRSMISYDMRGKRSEEMIKLFLDILFDLRSEEIPFVDIIHGHGTGALKKALYDEAKGHPDIDINFLEGNDGCSRVQLKKSF